MSKEQEQVVLGVIGHFENGWPDNLDAALANLSDDAYYQMVVPLTEPFRGKARVKAAIELQMSGCAQQRHEMKAIGSGEGVVFTERLDHVLLNGAWLEIPLVAVWNVNEDGKVTAWREYIDTTSVAKQIGVEAETLIRSFEPADNAVA